MTQSPFDASDKKSPSGLQMPERAWKHFCLEEAWPMIVDSGKHTQSNMRDKHAMMQHAQEEKKNEDRIRKLNITFERLAKEHCQKRKDCGSLKIYNKRKYDLQINFLYKNHKSSMRRAQGRNG